ncbi:MAG: NAD(P)H-dependent flavin oxidoreductase [Humibacter sp.]
MNKLSRDFGIEYPIFAFSHCRDVVAAVSKAGGMGVLGVVAMSPDEIDVEIAWLKEQCGDVPFGVDVVMPAKTADRERGLTDTGSLVDDLDKLIPEGHRAFAEALMDQYHVPMPRDAARRFGAKGLSAAYGAAQLEAVFAHDIPFLVSGLGAPPVETIERAHAKGAKVGALVGKPEHIAKSAGTGIDVYIAQSYEAAAHTGDIGSMVLTPDVVDAADGTPVLAAGGIATGRQMAAAMALGAEGIWTGSIWLTSQESSTDQRVKEHMLKMSSSDTVRSKSQTGKYNRQIRTPWTEAWDSPESPGNLPMPLQQMLYSEYTDRARRAGVWELVGGPVGQGVSRMNAIKSCNQIILEIVEEYAETLDRLAALRDELMA